MRKGWEYKKLGEVCEVVTGTTPKTNIPEYWGKGHYWVTPAELNDTTVYIDKTERQITDEALSKTKLRLLPVGTVLLSSRAPIGKVAIANAEMYCNQGFKNCICSEAIYNKYLFYFLRLKKDYLNSLGRGATFKEISKSIVESIKIPLPPKSTQLAIVSELDKINELIRLKKEQLKDFDNLAQSLFYEMFGDPVENEKGWEVKKIRDIAKYYNGVAHEQDVDKDGDFVLINAKFISSEGQIKKYTSIQRFPLLKNDIVMVLSDLPNGKSLAKCFLIDEDNKYTLNQRICCFRGFEGSSVYFKNIINRNPYLLSFDNGKGQTNLRKGDVEKLPIPLPPLSLQHLFAQRIEQIEREKSEVQKSIQDLETLLASRMQYWFE